MVTGEELKKRRFILRKKTNGKKGRGKKRLHLELAAFLLGLLRLHLALGLEELLLLLLVLHRLGHLGLVLLQPHPELLNSLACEEVRNVAGMNADDQVIRTMKRREESKEDVNEDGERKRDS